MGTTKTNLYTSEQNQLAALIKVFAHPARIAILQQLMQAPNCMNAEMVSQLGLSQASISQHLNELKKSGVLEVTSSGNKRYYCINSIVWKNVQKQLHAFFEANQNHTASCQ
ncbi:MAG: metalloregulator ArsR/SmtB family transcription factor [Schleiferiaceae bacterium]|nr:metalloregulator ArsR/SmtB family transcription factor [Schleiferiaceae bacterium]